MLFWILVNHSKAKNDGFSINELGRETGLSVGQVHKVIKQLEYNGIVISKGLRTNKKFYLKSPAKLLANWVKEYNLMKKTKTKGFSFSKTEDLDLEKLGLIPALHTAAGEIFHLKSTNLRTKEFYLLNWAKLPKVVDRLGLQELDRGYELLLVKPYYPALLQKISSLEKSDIWTKSYALLVVLDLCHFPLRGI